MADTIRREPRSPSSLVPKGRIAVSALFMMNGFVVGSWAPEIPEFAARFSLSESVMGLMILFFGVGSLVFMPLVGAHIARGGSAGILRLLAIVCALAIPAIVLSPHLWAAAGAIFLMGGVVGGMDVAMNANAVSVERGMRRAIMSSCHGFWSLGGLFGAAVGGYVIALAGTGAHAAFVMITGALLLTLAWRMVEADEPAKETERTRLRLPRTLAPYIVGLIALFSMIPEGAVLDWGALYILNERGAVQSEAGLAFGAFSATMAIMRFAGDTVRNRLGAVNTMRISTLFAIAGLVIAGLGTSAIMVIAGFAIAGIGIANIVPIAFSAAGNLPGLPPGVGIALVSMVGYAGLLFAPSVIGLIAEHTGFAPVFLSLPVLLLLPLAAAGLAASADGAD